MNVLEVNALHASIGGSRILRGINFVIPEKSVFCLMGRNGVGKTSTLRAVVGLLAPEAGSITLNGNRVHRMRPEERARHGISYVPQGREIFPHLTVGENLKIGAVARNKKSGSQLDRVFTLFPILKEFLPRKGGMLSGGQQQQLAIGRALLTEPKLLILDEPTEGIQPNIIDQIGEAIRLLRTEGRMSILLVEQYLDFCRELGDSFAILERGSVAAAGPITELTDVVVQKFSYSLRLAAHRWHESCAALPSILRISSTHASPNSLSLQSSSRGLRAPGSPGIRTPPATGHGGSG